MKRTPARLARDSSWPDPAAGWSKGLKVATGGQGVVAHAGVVLPRLLADRIGLTAGLRARGLDVADSQANFVWLPVGERAAGLAAELEARAVITRPFAGEGVRVTVGSPEEDDVFLEALDGVLATV